MIIADIINPAIPYLKTTDEAHKALVWMDKWKCTALPVVDKGKLLGFLSEEVILEGNDVEKKAGKFDIKGKTCFVHKNSHFYNALKVVGEHNLQLVAIVNDTQKYEGVVTVWDLIASFAQTGAIQMQGGVLVLSLNSRDYSLAEISRLIEENGAKILSSIITEDPINNSKVRLNLKINKQSLAHINSTLERFGYTIIGRYQENEKTFQEDERVDILMRYLNT